MEKSVSEKARVKPGTSVALLNAVSDVVEGLGLPSDIEYVDVPSAQLVLLFVNTRAELDALMPPTVTLLGPDSSIWVFYRKGSKAAGLDMNRDSVWAAAEPLGLRPLGLVSVDDTWSAFRFRRARIE